MSKLDDVLKETTDEPDNIINDIKETIEKRKNGVVKEEPPVAFIPVDDKEEPVINKDTELNNEDREKIIQQTLDKHKKKGIRLRRREKKMITGMEYDSVKSKQGIVMGLAIAGLVFLMVVGNFLPNQLMYVALIMIGSFMFIPVGMIMGWVILDPVMRCKVLRKVSRQNYGVVNFVGKGHKIVSKIKNFDYSLIWRQKDCWVLTRDKIYQLTKDGNAANDGHKLDPDSVVTLVETVPVVFVDMDSMEPLSIKQTGRTPVYPSEIGPSLKAWNDNQRAKLLAVKKTTDMLIYIAIIACAATVVISFTTMNKVDELYTLIQSTP